MLIPDSAGIRADPQGIYLDDHRTETREGLKVSKGSSYVLIDALTGAIHRSEIPDVHRTEMERVLGTVAVSQFEPATAPWPYNGEPPPESTTEFPSIRPDPGSGMYVEFVVGSSGYRGVTPTPADCDRAGEGITIHNWRSSGFIGRDANTGSICKKLSNVQPEDLAAFQRFLDRVELCVYENAEC